MPLSSFWDRLAWLRQPNRRVAPLADFGTQDGESILESHRREIVVVFCDVRGFTVFAERAEPEEAMACCDYHAALGPIVARFEGTLDHPQRRWGHSVLQ
jgi:adenylate cyclase